MGSWGYRALESDEGLDVVDCVREFIAKQTDIKLGDVLEMLRTVGMLPADANDRNDIEFLYDTCATATTELFFEFLENGKLEYDERGMDRFKRIRSFTAETDDLKYLLRFLKDIRDGKPDKDGIREYTELSLEGRQPQKWRAHIENLIRKLTETINITTS